MVPAETVIEFRDRSGQLAATVTLEQRTMFWSEGRFLPGPASGRHRELLIGLRRPRVSSRPRNPAKAGSRRSSRRGGRSTTAWTSANVMRNMRSPSAVFAGREDRRPPLRYRLALYPALVGRSLGEKCDQSVAGRGRYVVYVLGSRAIAPIARADLGA